MIMHDNTQSMVYESTIWYNDFKNPLTKKQTYGLNLKISKASSKFDINTKKIS